MKTVTIIPAYNEAQSIANVLKVVVGHPLIDEVIVIDDGSEDETSNIARKYTDKVIILDENLGKGKALDIGVGSTDAKVILFLDGDLTDFNRDHVTMLLRPVVEDGFDMSVGAIDRPHLKTLNNKQQILESPFSGMRAIKREVWDIIPDEYKNKFYVETALTYIARKKNLKIKPMVLPGVSHIIKEKKHGFVKGHLARWKMHFNIVFAGILIRLKKKKYGITS